MTGQMKLAFGLAAGGLLALPAHAVSTVSAYAVTPFDVQFNTDADINVPQTASAAGGIGNQTAVVAGTSTFGGINSSLNAASTPTPTSQARSYAAGGSWRDEFTLSTPGVASAYLYVNFSLDAFLTMTGIVADPLYSAREVRFFGALQSCDGNGGNCLQSYSLSHVGFWGTNGVPRTVLFNTIDGVTSVQNIAGTFVQTIDRDVTVRLRVDDGVAFQLLAQSDCSATIGGQATAGCEAPSGFRWGGVSGVTDLAGNALTNWTLSSMSGLDYRTAFPLSLPPLPVDPGEPPVGGVPEPASWAMLIAGFGLVGGLQRRRRTAVAA
jgi:hypothetical protein